MAALSLGRKGQFSLTINEGMLVIRMVFMIFVALSIVFVVNKFNVQTVDIRPLEANLLANRMIYSPDSLAYSSGLRGAQPGIINLSRFNEDILNSSVYYGPQNDYIASNLSLLFLDTMERKEAIYNSNGYTLLKPRAGYDGTGGAQEYFSWRYVLVDDGGSLRKAILYIDTIVPNN